MGYAQEIELPLPTNIEIYQVLESYTPSGICFWGENGTDCRGDFGSDVFTVPPEAIKMFTTTCWFEEGAAYCNNRHNPVFKSLDSIEDVATGGDSHSCARSATAVECIGANDFGQTKVPELSNPTHIAAGKDHSCALDNLGVHCWGSILYAANTGLPFCREKGYGMRCWGWDYKWPKVSRDFYDRIIGQIATGWFAD